MFPMKALIMENFSPWILAETFLSSKTVKPSLSQRLLQLMQVT